MLESAQNSPFSSLLRHSAVACADGASGSSCRFVSIQRVPLPARTSNSATREEFHTLHHARLPSRVATTVYGYAAGTRSLMLRSNVWEHVPRAAASSTTLSERLFAISNLS